jgi:hypothetical protein
MDVIGLHAIFLTASPDLNLSLENPSANLGSRYRLSVLLIVLLFRWFVETSLMLLTAGYSVYLPYFPLQLGSSIH